MVCDQRAVNSLHRVNTEQYALFLLSAYGMCGQAQRVPVDTEWFSSVLSFSDVITNSVTW